MHLVLEMEVVVVVKLGNGGSESRGQAWLAQLCCVGRCQAFEELL